MQELSPEKSLELAERTREIAVNAAKRTYEGVFDSIMAHSVRSVESYL